MASAHAPETLPAVTGGTGLVAQGGANEVALAANEAAVQAEIQGAIAVAQKFKRDEDRCLQLVLRSCQRPTFAEDAEYRFPRGNSTVHGPSIYFAREFARIWGNIRHGAYVVEDTAERRTLRAWAWDLQTNTKVEADAIFAKLIQRKMGNGQTDWKKPDERDLRELTNRHAAIAVRNCILSLLPTDMVDDALAACNRTLESKVKDDPDAARKNILAAFDKLNVPADQLRDILGVPVGQASPAQLVELRRIYASIRDGNSVIRDYLPKAAAPAPTNGDSVKERLRREQEEREKAQPAATEAKKPPRARKKAEPAATEAAPAAPATEPAGAPSSNLDWRSVTAATAAPTGAQMARIAQLANSSKEAKDLIGTTLDAWGMNDVDELNQGSAVELITLVENTLRT